MTAREAQSQLRKIGAYGETDLAVAPFGFACSPESQSALDEMAHLSSSSRARAHRAWLSCTTVPGWALSPEELALECKLCVRFQCAISNARIKCDLEAATKHIEVSVSGTKSKLLIN